MFNPPKTIERKLKSIRLLPETEDRIMKLAAAYGCTQAQVVDEIFATYTDDLLKQARNK